MKAAETVGGVRLTPDSRVAADLVISDGGAEAKYNGFGLLQQQHVGVCGCAQHCYEICPYR
ncbi:MAG: hypothetical protein AT715_04560 [Thermoproteus sp. JCHS_4]|nr:MAG: hypothetical protein AT715_04560 [Thermoproteus sp. JCHS_4]